MSAPFIAIATGGRDFVSSRARQREIQDQLIGAVAMFQGGANGFDKVAEHVALGSVRVPVYSVPALWEHQGKKAGPARNARMLPMALDLGRELDLPVRLLVGPGGRGTADMVAKARRAGLDIVAVCGAQP